MDLSKNEIGYDLEMTGFPTLYLWTEGVEVMRPIEFK